MDSLISWLEGDLSPTARIWATIAPAIFITAYFIIGVIIYTIWSRFRGTYRDKEMEARKASVFANVWIRLYFLWVTRPIWFVLTRSRIPAAAVTTLSFILAVGAAVAIALGRFALGGWLYLFAGMLDIFDGRLAREQGTESRSGAALDSILDRYSDGVVFIGFAWYYRDSWILLVVLAAMLGSMLISYIRARGEGLGVSVKVGAMQRAERILYLGVATAMSPILEALLVPDDPHPIHRLAVIGLLLLAITSQLTALHRFVYLLGALANKPVLALRQRNWGALLRTQTATAMATAADFFLMMLLVERFGLTPWLATMVGCLLGAMINFSLNRLWAVKASGSIGSQLARYAFIGVSSALLNGGGISVLMYLPTLDYRVAWLLVRVVIASAWNFPLQRDYVYASAHPAKAESAATSPLAADR